VLAGRPARHIKEPVDGHFLTQRERTREDNAGTAPQKSETLCEERLPLGLTFRSLMRSFARRRISTLLWNSAVPIELQAAARHSGTGSDPGSNAKCSPDGGQVRLSWVASQHLTPQESHRPAISALACLRSRNQLLTNADHRAWPQTISTVKIVAPAPPPGWERPTLLPRSGSDGGENSFHS
jgi:hypothetical protein